MNRFCILLILMSLSLSANAQEDMAKRIDSLYVDGVTYLDDERYPTALRQFNTALNLLENNPIENRVKVFVAIKAATARCYFRMKQADKAIETAREYVALYGDSISDKDKSYASYMDNLACYLLETDAQEALTWNTKAVALYTTIADAEDDLNVALIRQAEIYSKLEKPAEALKSQMQALIKIQSTYGEHSRKYLDELPYQIKYYEQNNEQARADKLSERYQKLKEEAESGYVPRMIEFTAESAHENLDNMHMCARYLLTHKLDAPNMTEAIDYIMGWSAASTDVQIGLGEEEAKIMQDQTFGVLIVAYVAACCQYGIDRHTSEFSPEMYRYGFVSMINYYNNNTDILGNNPDLDTYLKAYEKNGYTTLIEMIDANYPHEEEEEE